VHDFGESAGVVGPCFVCTGSKLVWAADDCLHLIEKSIALQLERGLLQLESSVGRWYQDPSHAQSCIYEISSALGNLVYKGFHGTARTQLCMLLESLLNVSVCDSIGVGHRPALKVER